jgi:cell division septation protein DedD
MRKSSVEQAIQQNSGSAVRRGFKFRPSENNGRPSMSSRRSSGRGWEIKLGPLQVVVWLGLALGAIFGSYFIGFFSGKYVGFEDARTASGGEVPKLALNEEVPDRSPKEWDNVYGKLGGAAVVSQDEKASAGDEQAASGKKAAEPKAPDQRIVKAVQEMQHDDAASARENSPAVVVKKDLLSDTDSIFSGDVGTGDAVLDDSPSKEISGKGGEVRVLGREVESLDGTTDAPAAPAQVKSAPPVVDDSKVAGKESPAKKVAALEADEEAATTKAKTSAEPKVKEPVKEKVSVVKRLPKGYFAQVAAPKTRTEAEDLARRIRKSGFPVVVEDNSTGRSPFYRVMVGPEDNKVQADRMLGQLKREKYLSGKAFVREVK